MLPVDIYFVSAGLELAPVCRCWPDQWGLGHGTRYTGVVGGLLRESLGKVRASLRHTRVGASWWSEDPVCSCSRGLSKAKVSLWNWLCPCGGDTRYLLWWLPKIPLSTSLRDLITLMWFSISWVAQVAERSSTSLNSDRFIWVWLRHGWCEAWNCTELTKLGVYD